MITYNIHDLHKNYSRHKDELTSGVLNQCRQYDNNANARLTKTITSLGILCWIGSNDNLNINVDYQTKVDIDLEKVQMASCLGWDDNVNIKFDN